MPIDFTAYTDPGVYVELIDPPVNNNTSITPTVVALVGAASDEGRQIKDSVLLSNQGSAELSDKGIDPFRLTVKDQWNLAQYTNASIGRVDEDVTESETSTSVIVRKRSNFSLPGGIANADFDGYRLIIDGTSYSATLMEQDDDTYTFEIETVSETGVPFIAASSVVNLDAPYVTPIKVGVLASTLAAGVNTFQVTQNYSSQIQSVVVDKTSGTVAVGTATLRYVEMSGTVAVGTVSIDLVTGGNFATAATVADELALYQATVTKIDSEESIEYVVAFGVDNPSSLSTTTNSVVTISDRGLQIGDSIQIDRERITITDFSEVNGTLELVTVRGADGTSAGQHGATDFYLVSGYDYAVTVDKGEEPELNGVDDLTLLSVISGGRLDSATGQYVQVSGVSTDAKQFAPEVFRDLDNVRTKYGKPLSTAATPTVLSNITLAAQLAFRNGADRVYCVAVETNDVQGFSDAFEKLEGIEEISVIVPVTGGLSADTTEDIAGELLAFLERQATLGNLIRGFVGFDGKVNNLNSSYFSSFAQGINNSRMTVVAPSRFSLQTSSGRLTVGGPFAAAAVAGLHAGLEVQMPLTRKQLEYSLKGVEDRFTGQEMINLQAAGVLVLSQDGTGPVVVRHGLTTDMTSPYSREISVVAARDRLRDLVYNTLVSAGILGSPITANTPEIVVANITGALELAKGATLIFDYSDVKYRIPTSNPTAIEVRFAYRPTMPLNYILVQFSVDTASSAVTFQSINEGGI